MNDLVKGLIFLALGASLGACAEHQPQRYDPETPCGQVMEIFFECGYRTAGFPGMPHHQEPLIAMEDGECSESLCYAECMLDVHDNLDECWECEFHDMECEESPASECPRQCES